MFALENLFAEIDLQHSSKPCLDDAEIDRFEKQNGYQLPADLKAFYRKYNSVKLFNDEYGFTYHFVPISEIHPTRKDIYGENANELGPSTWLTVCDVQNGNYIAIDLSSKKGDECNFIDCFHETFAQPGESQIIAKTFTELLDLALHNGHNLYYLQNNFVGYGDGMPLTAENAAIRIENPGASKKGWLVKFSVENNSYSEFFSDNDYGGKEKSFAAVRRYVDKKGSPH
jgi:hypothetical protein